MLATATLTPGTVGVGPTYLIVGILSVAFALGAWARAGLYCNHQDLSPKYAAALLGALGVGSGLEAARTPWLPPPPALTFAAAPVQG
jgi:ACS family sodium-dependent inorganic phosphate cotransporter